jgi:hypothetical protein
MMWGGLTLISHATGALLKCPPKAELPGKDDIFESMPLTTIDGHCRKVFASFLLELG